MLRQRLFAAMLLLAIVPMLPNHARAQAPPMIATWGSRGGGPGRFGLPTGIAVDAAGFVYVVDSDSAVIQKFTSGGAFVAAWGGHGSGPGQFNNLPLYAAVDHLGNLYVTCTAGYVNKYTTDGTFLQTLGSSGSESGQLGFACGIALDASGNVYVGEFSSTTARVEVFSSDGRFVTEWGVRGAGPGLLSTPMGLALDADQNVYVADQFDFRLEKFTNAGAFVAAWSIGTTAKTATSPLGSYPGQFGPMSVAIDGNGRVYVANSSRSRIEVYTPTGTLVTQWGSNGRGWGQFVDPNQIAIDLHGNVYVADMANYRIQVFGPLPPTAANTQTWGGLKATYR